MPIYEYQCSKCSERHEAIQSIHDAPLAHCAKCGGDLRKLFSSPAIQFKGSGFYKTDYPSSTAGRGGTSNSKAEGSKSEGSSGSDAGGGSSESKSETKSETKSESGTSSSKPDAKAAS